MTRKKVVSLIKYLTPKSQHTLTSSDLPRYQLLILDHHGITSSSSRAGAFSRD
mgnify:CR=1 FL=1